VRIFTSTALYLCLTRREFWKGANKWAWTHCIVRRRPSRTGSKTLRTSHGIADRQELFPLHPFRFCFGLVSERQNLADVGESMPLGTQVGTYNRSIGIWIRSLTSDIDLSEQSSKGEKTETKIMRTVPLMFVTKCNSTHHGVRSRRSASANSTQEEREDHSLTSTFTLQRAGCLQIWWAFSTLKGRIIYGA
jgi:hypothetical protein